MSLYTLSWSSTYLSLNQCHFISHVFERLGYIPKFKNPSVVEFSVLRGAYGCSWSNAIKAGSMTIYVFPFLKVRYVSDSGVEDTTLQIVLHSMCMGKFLSGLVFYWTLWGPVAQIRMTCITASCLWHGEVCLVWIHVYEHITGFITKDCIWVRCWIV